MKKKIKAEMFTLQQLKERGWSLATVKNFLGEPDETKVNPVFKSASPMQLFSGRRVKQKERTKGVQDAFDATRKRQASRELVTRRQESNLLAEVEKMDVGVSVWDAKKLLHNSIDAYNDWNMGKEDLCYASLKSDRLFLERIQVNFIRHELTDYDSHLYSVVRKVGVRKAEALIRAKIYNAIASAYPNFRDECVRQIERRSMF